LASPNIGLFRFDGENFDRYDWVGSEVICLLIDRTDNLWISSNQGLFKINRKRNDLTFIEGLEKIGKIEYLTVNSKNQIFINPYQNGVFYVDGNDLKRKEFSIDGDFVDKSDITELVIDGNDHF
jgi:ligand-binding sensor domain-containing protein